MNKLFEFKNGKKHKMFSATKSVTSALIGIAIDKGYIKDVHQTITQLFPNKEISNLGELKRALTLKDLLTMSSGFDCNDGSANQWAGTLAMRKTNEAGRFWPKGIYFMDEEIWLKYYCYFQ